MHLALAILAVLAAVFEPTEPGRIPPDTGYLGPHALPPTPSHDDELETIAAVPDPPAAEAGSRAGGRMLELLDEVLAEIADAPPERTRYDHHFRVNRSLGIYHWDCSQMLSWVLRHRAPTARKTVEKDRPVAWHYYRAIIEAPRNSFAGGWRKIEHIEDVRPGDVFAWRRPDSWPMGASSGHVGLVRAVPVAVPTLQNAYLVRIVDATSEPHQDDTRSDGKTGLGEGTMLFLTDADGVVVAYGWEGLQSTIYVNTDVQFGRVVG